MSIADAYGLEVAVVSLIRAAMPNLAKIAIEATPDEIVKPGISVVVPTGTVKKTPNGRALYMECPVQVLVAVHGMKKFEDLRREAHALVTAVCVVLQGAEVVGYNSISVVGWVDTTNKEYRADHLVVIRVSAVSGYKITLTPEEQEELLLGIDTGIVLKPGDDLPKVGDNLNLQEA